mmetsp:Transcript_13602/g.21382  ORF Transcript_13602/g.21382 Transcript_13602/m.21382 type:complete len:186 (+) Transcript_13602:91-648(+)|eukprot:CAMPEP_0197036270 /NCGR_PEP_ID=MMETSP1384-20130603/13833_1 /TAXON_ID=29189 /ORGANISM="Ammonia sp." /LENGTH=185 /DNA_ID=CAMNT_0042466433 /DNA_START=91 /DNA_END=648 /DNA_ORIENTATION=+
MGSSGSTTLSSSEKKNLDGYLLPTVYHMMQNDVGQYQAAQTALENYITQNGLEAKGAWKYIRADAMKRIEARASKMIKEGQLLSARRGYQNYDTYSAQTGFAPIGGNQFGYPMPNQIAYDGYGGHANDTVAALPMVLLVVLLFAVICLVLNVVVAAGCYFCGKTMANEQRKKTQYTDYQRVEEQV